MCRGSVCVEEGNDLAWARFVMVHWSYGFKPKRLSWLCCWHFKPIYGEKQCQCRSKSYGLKKNVFPYADKCPRYFQLQVLSWKVEDSAPAFSFSTSARLRETFVSPSTVTWQRFPKRTWVAQIPGMKQNKEKKKPPKRLTTLYLNVFFFCQDKHMHIATSSIFRNDLFTNLPNETITVFSSAFYWTSLSQRVMTIPAHSCYEFHHSCREWGN